MAKLKGLLNITGTLDSLSMYKMRGVDEVIVRRKGGPTKEMIKKSDSCVRIRENNTEFSTCSIMGRHIREALDISAYSSDYSSSGKLNAIMMQILKRDDQAERGKRGIMLSKNRELLENFDFGKLQTYISVVKRLPSVEIDREQLIAKVTLPDLEGEKHIYNFAAKPWLSYSIRFAVLSDLVYNEEYEKATPVNQSYQGCYETFESEWYPTKSVIPANEISLKLSEEKVAQIGENDSLLLSITLHFGDVGASGKPVLAKYAAVSRIFTVR